MNKRSTITLLIVFAFSQLVFSQYLVRGKVQDRNQSQPLIGAIIENSSNHQYVYTDESGNFQIEVQNDNTILEIRFLGYESKSVKVSDYTDHFVSIELQLSNTTLDEVVVNGSYSNFSSKIKGSNYKVSPVVLKNVNPLSTEEVLKSIPGVNIIGDMGLANRTNISIRGSWGRRSKKVLLMEDGTPSAPAPYIAPGAYYNPVSDRITSVEVYKGADLLRFGPNNMYGAINFITALPPQMPKFRLKLIAGQRNYKTGLFSYGGTWNNLGALVEGVYKKFDGFTDNSSIEVLNLNAKIFSKLSENQSLYFKVSGQFEDNQASLSSQTPYTFNTDPLQNPLDADQFTMRRYGLDVIHKYLFNKNQSLVSKIYASDFERDWWRQITTKIKASDARDYLGDNIFNERYSYLNNGNFSPEDYIIVGKITNGKEGTSDSRWTYTVSGIKETFKSVWDAFGAEQNFEASINFHHETFKDRFLLNDTSRWARYGTTTTDMRYRLWSLNGFFRNEFVINKFKFTPILRMEHVNMYRQNLLKLAQDSTINGITDGREPNIYTQFLPGLTAEYEMSSGTIFSSIYQGMIAPSKVFGFLVEQNGVVTNPLIDQSINIKPELSWNREIGWRSNFSNKAIESQITYFDNTSRNFYAGGRNEVFENLGKINVKGLELTFSAMVLNHNSHQLQFVSNVNLMKSKVLEGRLNDRDLFSQVIHSQSTKAEYVDKVNNNRQAFDIYMSDGNGGEYLSNKTTISLDDFNSITRSSILFGPDGVAPAEAPYTPKWNSTFGVNYNYKRLSSGISSHFVGKQFTEFHNFNNESADGAIGQLPAYNTIDAFINYDFKLNQEVQVNAFVNGKNITNKLYRASRLNRATSGIFGAGFRQIVFGLDINF